MESKQFDLEFIGFTGFYNGLFSDYLENNLDMDLMNLHDSLSKLHINEFNCWQTMDNKQFKVDIATRVMDKYVADLKMYLNDIIKIVDIDETVDVDTPPQHNYITDRIFKTVQISKDDFGKLIKFISMNDFVAEQFFYNHFTDYEGFHSYYPNKLDYWLDRKFDTVNELEVSYLIRCALIIRLYNSRNWRYNSNGDKQDDIKSIEVNYRDTVEEEVYSEVDFGYSDYVDWGLYQKELRHALDKEQVVLADVCADVINDTLWPLVDDWKINENNELVLK